MDTLPGCFQRGSSGLRWHRGGLTVSGGDPLCHQDSMHLLHTGAAVWMVVCVRCVGQCSDTLPSFLISTTAGTGCVRAGTGEVHPTDGQLRHCRNEAEEHRYHQDPHHCGPHWWQLLGQLLAWGLLFLSISLGGFYSQLFTWLFLCPFLLPYICFSKYAAVLYLVRSWSASVSWNWLSWLGQGWRPATSQGPCGAKRASLQAQRSRAATNIWV